MKNPGEELAKRARALGARYADSVSAQVVAELRQRLGSADAKLLQCAIFSNWSEYSHHATLQLSRAGFVHPNSDNTRALHGLESTLVFGSFTDGYEQAMRKQIDAICRKESEGTVPLNVPYAEKDQAKRLGARWDPAQKSWYVPAGTDPAPFQRWVQRAGEFTTETLYVDLVPSTAWFSNLRSELTKQEWRDLSHATYRLAANRCQVCGGQGPRHPVECHERWEFDLNSRTQSLLGTVALCPACHEVTHFGFARVRGRTNEALAHLMKVNAWSRNEAVDHVNTAMDLGRIRSKVEWKLDARWLLETVQLSSTTRDKILRHAVGLAERNVKDWEREIIEKQRLS